MPSKLPPAQTPDEIEMRPDAWERTEAAIKSAVRNTTQHLPSPKPKPSVVKKPR